MVLRLRMPSRLLGRWELAAGLRKHATDVPAPSTFSRLDVPELAPVVDGYLTHGFTIHGCLVKGSVALLPRAKFNWKVERFEDLTPESFALFHLIEPRLELVVLGTGSKVERVDPVIREYLRRKGISLEVQDTPNACATFNFLLDEGRPAGAALIPPLHIPP